MSETNLAPISLAQWQQLLNDTSALLLSPTKHHRELLDQAYSLRDTHEVDASTLAEMLELADEALMYAHAVKAEQHW